jgi:hypothetical protein
MSKFIWYKKGLIFSPNQQQDWLQTHAMLPTAEFVDNHTLKIYFASRNSHNQSYIGYLTICLKKFMVKTLSDNPLLTPGALGAFDDNGVLPSSILTINNKKHMYYIGFKPGGTTRMDLFGGVAKFIGDDRLERVSEAPIIERCAVNPYINTAPFVIENQTQENWYKFFMYYVAGVGWIHKDLPKYNIQIAFSNDGINWQREGKVCIDFKNDNETALARPYVIFIKNKYHMWFSYKGNAYCVGYASSEDGIHWIRDDEIGGLQPSFNTNAFDSEMVTYSCIVPYQDKLLMFYNGNNYGYAGIGLAIANV